MVLLPHEESKFLVINHKFLKNELSHSCLLSELTLLKATFDFEVSLAIVCFLQTKYSHQVELSGFYFDISLC